MSTFIVPLYFDVLVEGTSMVMEPHFAKTIESGGFTALGFALETSVSVPAA